MLNSNIANSNKNWVKIAIKMTTKQISLNRTVVVERSNALVYLMTRALVLKVEGSNPAIFFFEREIVGQECNVINSRSFSRINPP